MWRRKGDRIIFYRNGNLDAKSFQNKKQLRDESKGERTATSGEETRQVAKKKGRLRSFLTRRTLGVKLQDPVNVYVIF